MIKVNLKAQRVIGVVGLAFFLSSGYGWVTEKCTPTTCDSATTVRCSNFGPGWRKCDCKAGYARPNDNATACVSLTQASVNPCAPNNGAGPCDPKSTNCTVGSNPPKAFCNCKPGYIKVNDTMCAVPPSPVAPPAPPVATNPCDGKQLGDSAVGYPGSVIYELPQADNGQACLIYKVQPDLPDAVLAKAKAICSEQGYDLPELNTITVLDLSKLGPDFQKGIIMSSLVAQDRFTRVFDIETRAEGYLPIEGLASGSSPGTHAPYHLICSKTLQSNPK